MKPSIRKRDGRWVLTRPGFGFAPVADVTVHGSWRAARAALLGDAVGSAGPIVERGFHTLPALNDWGRARHGTIRLEET